MTLRPVPDEQSAGYWAALNEGRVLLQGCSRCASRTVPLTPTCPRCGSGDVGPVEAPGTGSIYSFVTVHRTVSAAFANDVPYTVATVDLDGGGRCFGRVVPGDGVTIGARVTPVFHRRDGWTELRFRPEDGS